jgi:hypothetical protein
MHMFYRSDEDLLESWLHFFQFSKLNETGDVVYVFFYLIFSIKSPGYFVDAVTSIQSINMPCFV